MGRRIVLCLSHSIEEHDQLRLLSEIGHEVASIGGYIDPAHPHDPKRPPLPQIPVVQTIKDAVDAIGSDDNLGAAQSYLPDAVLDWADTIIYHHYLDRLYGQWSRIKDWLEGDSNRRVIWRTVGQSVEGNEMQARPFRKDGLEILRYSPKERNIPGYAGEDALIRFYKDPEEWKGWTGENPVVINFTQHLYQRSLDQYGNVAPPGQQYCSWQFWEMATQGLPREAMGPGSEIIGGRGEIPMDEMQDALRSARVYLYTGTQPASYTLGLIEAMMTGIPVVSIGPSWMQVFPYGPDLFEGHEIAGPAKPFDDPADARRALEALLANPDEAWQWSNWQGRRAFDLFGIDTIREQWRAFLA